MVFFGVQFVPEITKIHLERWIGDNVVKLHQGFAILVIGMQQGVALNDVLDGMHQIVQDQVKPQQTGRFLRNVLGENGTAVFTNGMGNVHQQGARTGGGIVTGDVFNFALLCFRHQNGGHNLGDRMRRVILGVFAAAVFVVVFNQVLKQGGVKVVFLIEDALKAEFNQFIDDRPAKSIAFGGVGDEFTHPVKQA